MPVWHFAALVALCAALNVASATPAAALAAARMLQGGPSACAIELWAEVGRISGASDASVWGAALDGILNGPNCTQSSKITSSLAVSWLRYPSWYNGLATEAIMDIKVDPSAFGLDVDVVLVQATDLPAITTFTNAGSMRDYASMQDGAFAITSTDLSTIPMLAAWNRVRTNPYLERVCVNDSDPRGLLPPRNQLLLFYRPDAMQQLAGAGRLPDARAPDDWDELINLLRVHAAYVAARAAASGDTTPFPTYGLCITAETGCGRLGDVLAAVAASVVQTSGTQQGYVYDVQSAAAGGFSRTAEPHLVNGTGWQYAAELLRAMLPYNAPPVPDAEEGGKECTDISDRFGEGDCLMTIEWDSVYLELRRYPLLMQSGALAFATLPGSRRVLDRRAGSATEGAVVPCTWELCAASANHDLLYLGSGVSLGGAGSGNRTAAAAAVAAAAQRLAPLAPPEAVLVNGVALPGCSPRSTVALEAAGVTEVLALLSGSGAVRMTEPPVNRVPYSVLAQGWVTYNFDGTTNNANSIAAIASVVNRRLAVQGDALASALGTARASMGYPVGPNGTADASGTASLFTRTRWWTALAQPLDVSIYATWGFDPATSQSFLRAMWHSIHAPNAAPDLPSPVLVNFGKAALSYAAAMLAPPTAAPAANATGVLAGVLDMIDEAFGEDLVRYTYNAYIDSASPEDDMGPAPRGGADSGNSSPLAAILAGVLVAVGAVGAGLLLLFFLRRGRHRDLLGRVRAPRAGPDTTLLVSDVQNSTRLWEELSVATMDCALKLHHEAIRRVLAQHDGYESATEGDSFICAFSSAAKACDFAAAAQLALLRQDWPPELLAHPDGALLAAEPRDAALQAMGASAATRAQARGTAAGGWRPFCALRPLLARITGRGAGAGGGAAAPSAGGGAEAGAGVGADGRAGASLELTAPDAALATLAAGADAAQRPAGGVEGAAAPAGDAVDSATGEEQPLDAVTLSLAMELVGGWGGGGSGAAVSSRRVAPLLPRHSNSDSAISAVQGGAESPEFGRGSTATADDPRFSMASSTGLSALGLLGMGHSHSHGPGAGHGAGGAGGAWWPGAGSTWGRALTAAFPQAGTAAGGPAAPRYTCRAHAERRALCYRGLRVRMGIHTGLEDPQHVVFNKVGSAFKYYGPFLETAKLVGDAAPGGLITLSAQTFARLRNTGAAAGGALGRGRGGSGGGGTSVVVVYAGHHVLSEEAGAGAGKGKGGGAGVPPAASAAQLLPTLPSSGSNSLSADQVALQLVTATDKGGDRGPSSGPNSSGGFSGVGRGDGAAAAAEWAAGSPLFVAVPASLLCRLAHSAPLRSVRQVAPGTMAAPIGSVVVAFMKVVGASTLLADLPGPATRALESLHRLACGLLGGCGGYLVEGGDGLVLAAFGSPAAGVEWALDCVEGLRRMAWEEELLGHELCEEVLTLGASEPAAAHLAAPPPAAPASTTPPARPPHPSPSPLGTSPAAAHGWIEAAWAAAAGGGPRTASPARSGGREGPVPSGRSLHIRPHAPPVLAPVPSDGPLLRGMGPSRRLERGLRLKVGLDVGPVTYSLTESSGRLSYRGKVMNRAARIAGTAAAGQVLASGAVWRAVELAEAGGAGCGRAAGRGSGVAGLSLGRLALKGITAPVEVVLCTRGG